jgi:hypothetical protein
VPDQTIEDPQGIRSHDQLVMVGAEVLRHPPRVRELVEIRLVEADGKGLDRPCRHAGHQRDDETGVDAARQERAERHVAHHVR